MQDLGDDGNEEEEENSTDEEVEDEPLDDLYDSNEAGKSYEKDECEDRLMTDNQSFVSRSKRPRRSFTIPRHVPTPAPKRVPNLRKPMLN